MRFVSVACLCAFVAVCQSAGAQEPGVEFAVEPAPGSQTAPRGGYFLLEAEAGEDVGQTLDLRNESGRPIELRLAAVDATTGQLGGVSYGLPEEAVESVGSWISMKETKVSLGAGEARSVDFDVSVPADATGGEHIAGIAVWALGEEGNEKQDEAVSVNVQTRRIIAVQVDLPGPQVPELVVTGVEAAARPDGLYLEIGIENQGTAMTTGEGTIEIPDQGFVEDFAVDTFVPGTSIGYPLKWTDDPREGTYDARVELEYEGVLTEWAGTFTVGDPVLDELEDRGVDVPAGFPVVPAALGAGLLAVGAGIWWVLRRRRQAAPRSRRPGAGRRSPQQVPPARRTQPVPQHTAAQPRPAPQRDAMRPRYPVTGPPPPPPPPPATGPSGGKRPAP